MKVGLRSSRQGDQVMEAGMKNGDRSWEQRDISKLLEKNIISINKSYFKNYHVKTVGS